MEEKDVIEICMNFKPPRLISCKLPPIKCDLVLIFLCEVKFSKKTKNSEEFKNL